MQIRSVATAKVSGKTVLLRVDFNVIQAGKVIEDLRIVRALPTIQWLLKRGAKVVIVSHAGRPGGYTKTLSLEPAGKHLARLLGKKVHFFYHHVQEVKGVIARLPQKSVILLENIRFYPEEERSDPGFARLLASLADLYVNDAFGVAHRKSASLVEITKYLPSYAGFLLQKELSALTRIRKADKKSLVVIMGGAKLKDKLPLVEKFLPRSKCILTGGGVANTLIKAKGIEVGKSLYEKRLGREAKKLIQIPKIIVPIDWRTAANKIFDIGPKTVKIYQWHIAKARMILWNGPVGLTEDKRFRAGSRAVAQAIVSNRKAYSVVGGGDTVAFIERLGLLDKFSFVSTGGGAMLEFLAGKKLPAVEALKRSKRN